MLSDTDIARRLLTGSNSAQDTNDDSRPYTTYTTGTALAASSAGTVAVRLPGNMTTTDGQVVLPTTAAVNAGDRVMVSSTGKAGRARSLLVVGVVGGGDAARAATQAAADAADAAANTTAGLLASTKDNGTQLSQAMVSLAAVQADTKTNGEAIKATDSKVDATTKTVEEVRQTVEAVRQSIDSINSTLSTFNATLSNISNILSKFGIK